MSPTYISRALFAILLRLGGTAGLQATSGLLKYSLYLRDFPIIYWILAPWQPSKARLRDDKLNTIQMVIYKFEIAKRRIHNRSMNILPV